MRIVLKSTKGTSRSADFDSSMTIADVKNSLQNQYDTRTVRICHRGKLLDEAKTIAEIGIAEGDILFIAGKELSSPLSAALSAGQASEVASSLAAAGASISAAAEAATATASAPIHVLPAASEPPPASATTEQTETSASQSATSVPAAAPPTAEPTRASSATDAPVSLAFSEPSASANSDVVDAVCAMGFSDKNLVSLALRAAFMNPDRAVEYLVAGVPQHKLQEMAAENAPAVPRPVVQAPRSDTAATPSTVLPQNVSSRDTSSALRAALANIPHFDEIREIVATNPSALPTVLQQLRTTHPETFALAQQDPQEFLSLLAHGTGTPGAPQSSPQASTAPRQLVLTPEDMEPIQRLVSLGGGMWDEQAATITYLACNRNEEVTANILFDHGGLPPQLAQALMEAPLGNDNDDNEPNEERE